jgi:hypothetical protein
MEFTSVVLATILGVAFCSAVGCSRDTRFPTRTMPYEGPAASDATEYIGPKRRPTKPQQTEPRDSPPR